MQQSLKSNFKVHPLHEPVSNIRKMFPLVACSVPRSCQSTQNHEQQQHQERLTGQYSGDGRRSGRRTPQVKDHGRSHEEEERGGPVVPDLVFLLDTTCGQHAHRMADRPNTHERLRDRSYLNHNQNSVSRSCEESLMVSCLLVSVFMIIIL